MTRSRQAILAVAAVLALVAVYRDPYGSGEAVRGVFSMLAGLVHGVFEFAGAVVG